MSDDPRSPTNGAAFPPGAEPVFESPAAEVERLREALAAKTRELEAAQDKHVRLVAEFDNTRKRQAREREEQARFANEALIREVLPVLDNFDRALAAARAEPAAAAVTAGVELILREFLRVLEKFGATPFSAVGQRFDPSRHEAVARVPTRAHPEMTVIDESARGYLLNGRVLRPAMVTVAMSPEDPA